MNPSLVNLHRKIKIHCYFGEERENILEVCKAIFVWTVTIVMMLIVILHIGRIANWIVSQEYVVLAKASSHSLNS